jgi:anti-sigma regulatory factor (Ser/Thr protein kinase)
MTIAPAGPAAPCPAADLLDLELRLPADLAAPAAARRAAQQALATLPTSAAPELADAALLVISELVTNAVVHGGGRERPVTVELHLHPRYLTVTVTDGHRGPGTLASHPARPARLHEEHGRGLAIVSALTSAHGHSSGPDHTTVWAHLPLPA